MRSMQTCKNCGGPMVQMVFTSVCKAECDLKGTPVQAGASVSLVNPNHTHNVHPIPTMHDFRDGKGLVTAHQHVNGGGWVADTATVAATCYVGPDALVYGYSIIEDTVRVTERARVFGSAYLFEGVTVGGDALISGGASVSGLAYIHENSIVMESAVVREKAVVRGNVTIGGDCVICGDCVAEGTGTFSTGRYDTGTLR